MSARDNSRNVNRVRLESPLKVVLGSIGSEIRYSLETNDVSDKGFFLQFEQPDRFPFNQSSIIEIWLELDGDNTIFFNGKIARVVQPEDEAANVNGPGIGVRVVQISSDDQSFLNNYIKKLSSESSQPTPVESQAS